MTNWHDNAACRDQWELYDTADYELQGRRALRGSTPGPAAQEAIAICATCPVLAACEQAMRTDEDNHPYSIRAGKTPIQRGARTNRTKREPLQEGPVITCGRCGEQTSDRVPGRNRCRDCHKAINRIKQAEYRAKHGRPDRMNPEEREKHRLRQQRLRAKKAGIAA